MLCWQNLREEYCSFITLQHLSIDTCNMCFWLCIMLTVLYIITWHVTWHATWQTCWQNQTCIFYLLLFLPFHDLLEFSSNKKLSITCFYVLHFDHLHDQQHTWFMNKVTDTTYDLHYTPTKFWLVWLIKQVTDTTWSPLYTINFDWWGLSSKSRTLQVMSTIYHHNFDLCPL